MNSKRKRHYSPTGEMSLTKKSYHDKTDINKIMGKFKKTGILENPVPTISAQREPKFGDFRLPDYQQSLNMVIEMNEHFKELPSTVRKRFGNDPEKMLEFLGDPKNRDEAIKLGLLQVNEDEEKKQIRILKTGFEGALKSQKKEEENPPKSQKKE